jgi:hypothetical protein
VAVLPTAPGNPEFAPGRTLWYAKYNLDRQTLTVKFYLGKKPDPADKDRVILQYSSSKMYELKK